MFNNLFNFTSYGIVQKGVLLNYLSVLDYGATGDGVTDDYAAMQLAIDTAQNSANAVKVPAGHYIISDNLLITNDKFNLLLEENVTLEFSNGITPSWVIFNTTTPESATGATGAKTGLIVVNANNVNITSNATFKPNIANNNGEYSPGITLYTEGLTFYDCNNSMLTGYTTFSDVRSCVGIWNCENVTVDGMYRDSVNSGHLLQSTIVAIGGCQDTLIKNAKDNPTNVSYANGVIEGIDLNNGNNRTTIDYCDVWTNIELNGTSNTTISNTKWSNSNLLLQTRSTQKYSYTNFETVSGSNFDGLYVNNCNPVLSGETSEAYKLISFDTGYDNYNVVFDSYNPEIKTGALYNAASVFYALLPSTFKSIQFKKCEPTTEIPIDGNNFLRFSNDCVIEDGLFEDNIFTFQAFDETAAVVTILDADYLEFNGNTFVTTNNKGRGAALGQIVGTIVTTNNDFVGNWDTEFDLPA